MLVLLIVIKRKDLMVYKKIEDYGIIGNLDTCALTGVDGSIDWCCFPHIESKSVFAAILDDDKGGRFRISPLDDYQSRQNYIENTNVLVTEFTTASDSVGAITDFMPLKGWDSDDEISHQAIYRKVSATRGSVEFRLEFSPRFDYARAETTLTLGPQGVIATGGGEELFLNAKIPLEVEGGNATARFKINEGDEIWIVLLYGHKEPLDRKVCEDLLESTKKFWQEWSHSCERKVCVFDGPWHDQITRSGLILKLLTHQQAGSISAAPTTSLPEVIGGDRNWDYRFNWIRDASFSVQALFNLGHISEAKSHLSWFMSICTGTKDPADINILYSLHGEKEQTEEILGHLSGYLDSRPVRIGNGAAGQKQHDVFGELISAIYDVGRYENGLSEDIWIFLKRIVDHCVDVWVTKDAGIWEVRGDEKHFVYSKLMCWVAVDRGIKVAEMIGVSDDTSKWHRERERIRETIIERGFNTKLNSFVQSYDSDVLDATNLLMPIMEFLPIDDPMVQGTIEKTLSELMTEDGLVYRYNGEDGLSGKEGAFILCSFWLVDVLAMSDRVEEAEKVFLNVLKHISPLGLFSEEIDPVTKNLLGNYPQAFSHIGLINSALYLGRAKGKKQMGPQPVGDTDR